MQQSLVDFRAALVAIGYQQLRNLRDISNYLMVLLAAMNMMALLAMPHLEKVTGEVVPKNLFAVYRLMKVLVVLSCNWDKFKLALLLSFGLIFHSSSKLLNVFLSLPWSCVFVRTAIRLSEHCIIFLADEASGQFLVTVVVIYAMFLITQLYIAYMLVLEKFLFDALSLVYNCFIQMRGGHEGRLHPGATSEDFSSFHVDSPWLNSRRRFNLLNNALMENEIESEYDQSAGKKGSSPHIPFLINFTCTSSKFIILLAGDH